MMFLASVPATAANNLRPLIMKNSGIKNNTNKNKRHCKSDNKIKILGVVIKSEL